MSNQPHQKSSHSSLKQGPRQLLILLFLVGVLVFLHRFASPSLRGPDPTVMLAFGFVVLASYTIGSLVGVIRLPHITGYLISGLLFGPSIAYLLPESFHVPPFGQGVVNDSIIGKLGLLDSLAVALIAVTAGGELHLQGLRKGIKAISGVLIGQLIVIVVLITAFVWFIGGWNAAVALPGLGTLPTTALIALGLTLAAISFATSPAATIAVVSESNASGPMTRTIVSSVVLKDVFVVILFSVASTAALSALNLQNSEQGLIGYLFQHIVGSVAGGVIAGIAVILYLRYVGKEILLFIVGLSYTGTFLAEQFHLDVVLLFLTAGFTVTNFSKQGEKLSQSVEKLSTPVYVLFFTLAGARLHLHDLFQVAPFALGLVVVRIFAIWLGVRFGGKAGGADEGTVRFGWMGFISQAGVTITLAEMLASSFGETGQALRTLVISGVALNELMGPVLLKVALGLGGEISSSANESADGDQRRLSMVPPEENTDGEGAGDVTVWDGIAAIKNPWGPKPTTKTAELNQVLTTLRRSLQNLADQIRGNTISDFRRSQEAYIRELRREFLRHHRRLMVQSRNFETPEGFANWVRTEQAQLASRWRSIVLSHAAEFKKDLWFPKTVIDEVDQLVDNLPSTLPVQWESSSFEYKEDESMMQTIGRFFLRLKRKLFVSTNSEMPERELHLRTLAQYHLSGRVPSGLEGFVALLVQGDRHLADRTRSLLDGIVDRYDQIAQRMHTEDLQIGDELQRIRKEVEEEIMVSMDESSQISKDAYRRICSVLGLRFQDLVDDSKIYGTWDLHGYERRASRVYKDRMRALSSLGVNLDGIAKTVAANYNMLALELELVALEAQVKDVLEDHVSGLEKDVRGRALLQVQRVESALENTLDKVQLALDSADLLGEQMMETLKSEMDATEKIVNEAYSGVTQLRDQLTNEETAGPLFESLLRASRSLTEYYEVSHGRMHRGEWKLPRAVPPVEVHFRTLVVGHVETQIAPALNTNLREVAFKVQPLITSFQELQRLLAFNIELASGELEVFLDEPVPPETREMLHEMFMGGFERNLAALKNHGETAANWSNELGGNIRGAVLGSIEGLRGELVDGDISKTRLDAMRRVVTGRRLIQEAGQLPSLLVRFRVQFTNSAKSFIGEERLFSLKRFLGLPIAQEQQNQLPSFTPPKLIPTLPLVYRRLFSADTLEAGDVLTGREEEIERARKLLSKKKGNKFQCVALVGIDGVGKAAIATAIIRSRSWKQVRSIKFSKPVTIEEVRNLYKDSPEGNLFVVDGLHWLVSMKPGGFKLIREFISGVIADGGRNAWLIRADSLFWQYACHIAPIQDAFPDVIELQPLSQNSLQSAVLARHALSGYGLSFHAQPAGSWAEQFIVRWVNRIRRPYERYFRQLHRASGGLVRDALRLWLSSIQKVDELDDFVHLGTLPPSPYTLLKRLPVDILLQIYQIARQGWMDAETHAYLFRTDLTTAEAQLTKLTHLGLLQKKERTYRISLHLRGSVMRVLQERGWIS